jgi:hypothetical protein
LKELWSDRLLAHLIANPSKLKYGQEILHGDLQRLYYDLGYLHTPYPNIEEDMEFTRVLIIKKNWRKTEVRELNCIALFGPLKQILADLHNFCRFAHL